MKNPTTFITKGGVSDADLVRAARDMYEALGALLHEVDASGNGTAPDYGWPAAVSASRAAIAKARGDRA
jgi:hypothetical protein